METPQPQNQTNSKIGRCIIFLTKKTGTFIRWGGCILIHYQIMTVICTRLGIDIRSFPDTMEYRLILIYLFLMQYAFIIWAYTEINKLLGYLAKPIKYALDILEKKIENHLERGK